jgi:FkbM family methyltransferase
MTPVADNRTEEFKHEYDLHSLVCIRPLGRLFDMEVTPRYLPHFAKDPFEAFTADLVANLVTRHSLFIDVGAHVGFYSLLTGIRRPGLEIIALEPVPETFAILERNARRNALQSIQLLQAAASDRDARGFINIALASDSCGFYPHPSAPPLRQCEVQLIRLDTLLAGHAPCPALVKVDTEGHELAVLAGMTEALERFADVSLILEFNPKMLRLAGHAPEDLFITIDKLGFDAYVLDDYARRACKSTAPQAWPDFVKRTAAVNLYCPRRERSRSVCFFSHSPHLAGAERSLLELVTELVQDHGAICTVVLPDEGPLAGQLDGIGAARLHTSYGWWVSAGTVEPAALRAELGRGLANILTELLEDIRQINPDVLVTNTMVIPWGAIAARLLEKPHIWHVCEHGGFEHSVLPHQDLLSLIEHSSAFICTGSDTLRRDLFPRLGDDRCMALLRHIDIPPQASSPVPPNQYRKPNALRLAVFGTLCEGKGQIDAVKAMDELVRRGHNVELLLAGYGDQEYRGLLERMVRDLGLQDRVRISEFLRDVYAAVRQTDVVLVCSRHEGFGRTPVEAMLLQKPVVYPGSGVFLEYMEDGKTGLAYPPGDVSALVERIETLLVNPGLRDQLARAGEAHAKAVFTRENYGGRFIELCHRLCNAPLRPRNGTEHLLLEAMRWLQAHLKSLGATPEALSAAVRRLEQDRQRQERELDAIRNTLAWRLCSPYWRAVDHLLPLGTKRRRALDALFSLLKPRTRTML